MPMLAQSVTDKHLSVVDKKVSEALAPSKAQLITSTMDFSALASMDSGSTEAMVVFDSLRDISKRLKGATLLVAANAKLASIDAVALRLAIDTADLAGIKVPMKYEALMKTHPVFINPSFINAKKNKNNMKI